MALQAILDALRTILLAVPGMSTQVYTYEPWAAQASAVRTMFATNGRLHVWTMTRESTEETRLATGRENERRHTLVLRGYYAMDQAGQSAATIQALVEAVCDALRVTPTFGGVVEYSEAPQVAMVEPRMFCETLCHYVELRIVAQELISW